MRRSRRRWVVTAMIAGALLAIVPSLWLCLTYRPRMYRDLREHQAPREVRLRQAKQFVAQSLQLRNDIDNEPYWQAAFTDEEVNAWLAEDLVTSFADQMPAQVHDPRIAFQDGRIVLAFELDRGPFRTVISIAGRAVVPEDNVLAVTLESVHAGLLPIRADQFLDRISAKAQQYGLDLTWRHDGGTPVALIRYTTDPDRADVVLERMDILNGVLLLGGRSDRTKGNGFRATLPSRKVLQSTFPRRNRQVGPDVS